LHKRSITSTKHRGTSVLVHTQLFLVNKSVFIKDTRIHTNNQSAGFLGKEFPSGNNTKFCVVWTEHLRALLTPTKLYAGFFVSRTQQKLLFAVFQMCDTSDNGLRHQVETIF